MSVKLAVDTVAVGFFSVETEENGDLWSTNERGSSLLGLLGSLCRYMRFLFCLGFL